MRQCFGHGQDYNLQTLLELPALNSRVCARGYVIYFLGAATNNKEYNHLPRDRQLVVLSIVATVKPESKVTFGIKGWIPIFNNLYLHHHYIDFLLQQQSVDCCLPFHCPNSPISS